MARHEDDAMLTIDRDMGTNGVTYEIADKMHSTFSGTERSAIVAAAADSDPGVLDAWYAALPSTDDRRAWWAALPGWRRNVFRAAILLA